VTRCSASNAEYPGARVLICTWTLVMSGVASIREAREIPRAERRERCREEEHQPAMRNGVSNDPFEHWHRGPHPRHSISRCRP